MEGVATLPLGVVMIKKIFITILDPGCPCL